MGKMIGIRIGSERSEAAVMKHGQPVFLGEDRGLAMDLLYGKGKDTEPYRLQEEAAIRIHALRKKAEAYLGEKVTEAIVSIPGMFGVRQQKAIEDAGKIAGITVKRVVQESLMVALAICFEQCHQNGAFEGRFLSIAYDTQMCDLTMFDFADDVLEALAVTGSHVPEDITASRMEQLAAKVIRDAEISPYCVFVTGAQAKHPSVEEALHKATGIASIISNGLEHYGAFGAAIQGGKLAGESACGNILTLPCTHKCYLLKTSDQKTEILLDEQVTIAAKSKVTFPTRVENQNAMDIHLLEGNGPDLSDASLLHEFHVDGIPGGTAGAQELDVIMDIDSDEHMLVELRGKWSKDPIATWSPEGLSQEQIRIAGSNIKQKESQERASSSASSDIKATPNAFAQAYDKGVYDSVMRILPALDNLERGLDMLDAQAKKDGFAQGVEQVCRQIRNQLAELGVEEIPAMGRRFNHEIHEAVEHIDDPTYCEGQIVRVYLKGYTLNGKVIRYAKVAVTN